MPPTITHIAVKPTERTGTIEASDDKVVRKYSRVYVIQTAAPATEGEMADIEDPLIPSVGDGYPTNAFARVKIRNVRSIGGPLVWEMTIEWDTETSDQEEEPNPIDRYPVVTTSTVNYSRPLDRDADGEPVTNTVGEPFNPQAETEDIRQTIHIAVNLASVDSGWLSSFRRHVNAGRFQVRDKVQTWTFDDNTLLFHGYNIQPLTENGINFYRVGYTFQEKPEGWNPRELLNTGFRFFELFPGVAGITFVPRNVQDIAGADLNQPRLLNEDGTLAPLPLPAGFQPHYVKVKEFPKRNFAQLLAA